MTSNKIRSSFFLKNIKHVSQFIEMKEKGTIIIDRCDIKRKSI